jgi:GTP diphosphokinase / guanosine-3',5'-bis(diphosphate) 3'-diphosphatase
LMQNTLDRGLVDKALEFASERHKGQLDDQGRPYFFAHVVQVYGILIDVSDDTEILCAGLLHDVLEDTNTTYEELRNVFTPNIAEIVKMVTHEKHSKVFPNLNSTDEYNVLFHKAVLVKFADRLSNLSRMESWSDAKRREYINSSIFWKTGNAS